MPDIYATFYTGLTEIRELFHKSGRFDDSNSKLDEIVKLIAIYLHQKRYPTKLSLQLLTQKYEKDKRFDLVGELREAFQRVIQHRTFQNADGTSIFGARPQLALQDSDVTLCFDLLNLILKAVEGAEEVDNNGKQFDLLNEAFGHFVRDNFRNHIEDAQYMTPPEVVEFACRIALHDISFERGNVEGITMLDPCCGVGSFLSTFYRFAKAKYPQDQLRIVGQDKVDRMVRLSKINMMLFDATNYQIEQGNSLIGRSPLTQLDGQVDLILTNPPFGARFANSDIFDQFALRYPLMHDLAKTKGRKFSSELLFVDRCMALLKPGGRLLAILPDSVISSKGVAATLRQRLARYATIEMITELPTVTFAQAGTRTKTHVLYVTKNRQLAQSSRPVFMALSRSLGFDLIFDGFASNRGGFNSNQGQFDQFRSKIGLKSE